MCCIKTVCLDFRPLKKDQQDIGSDTDFTQSSMEDLSVKYSRRLDEASICDHRSQEQKHYRGGSSQPRRPIQRELEDTTTSLFTLSLWFYFIASKTFTQLGIWHSLIWTIET